MTRVFLAAGVAALAIAAPASAGPHGGHGGGGQPTVVNRGGGGGGGPHGGGSAAPRMQMRAQRAQRAPMQMHAQRAQRAPMQMHAQRAQRVARPQRAQRFAQTRQTRAPQHAQRAQMHAQRQHAPHVQRMQTRVAGQHAHANRMQAQNRQQLRTNHMQAQNRQQLRANRMQAQNRQQLRGNRMQAQNMRGQRMQFQNQMAGRQRLQANGAAQFQNRMAAREQLRANRFAMMNTANRGVGFGVGGCPPGLASKGCMPPGQSGQGFRQMAVQDRIAALQSLGPSRFQTLDFAPRTRFLDPLAASALVGFPLGTAASFAAFSPMPAAFSYLYPPTSAYYYEYGDGYAYRIDRTSLLIDALIPLLAGGFLPGTYLPSAYMSSYVPAYYGLDSFYPADYGYGVGYGYGAGYGGGYASLCNRYAYGVVYQVDCGTGFVENVIPTYAGGYGVGQLLPSSYAYYNVPNQYRGMYYDTADYNYWYAPGAIYQYDPRSSLITSVAALLSPGFSVGQPLPSGYGAYNVPYGYRATYYDTPAAYYRYNDGYIYQVDPQTMLVSSIVASVLT
jgi:hypothetical protein